MVPGRSTLVMRWLQKRAEEVPFLSPVPQILWEPERTSHEPQFPRLHDGGDEGLVPCLTRSRADTCTGSC